MKPMLISAAVLAALSMTGTAWAAGSVEAGKTKAAKCAVCHGAAGEGSGSAPALAGMKKDVFEHEMQEYAAEHKNNPMMQNFAKALSKQDVDDLAAYYGSLKKK
jgi:cytochrome c553